MNVFSINLSNEMVIK